MRLRQRQPPGRWKQLLLRSGERAWSGTPTHQSSVLQFNGLPVLGEASLEYGVDGFSLIRRALFCQLLPADISECHGGPERGASAGIAAARRWKRRRCRWQTSRGLASVDIQGRVQLAIPSFFGKGRKGPSDGYRFRSTRPTGCPLTRKDRGPDTGGCPACLHESVFWLWSHFLTGGMGKQALNDCSGGGCRRLEPLDWLRRGAQARAACQMRFRLLPVRGDLFDPDCSGESRAEVKRR